MTCSTEPQKIAAALSSQQRLALVGVGAGFVWYYGKFTFNKIPSYHQYTQTNNIRIQTINHFSRVCHALFTRGLIENEKEDTFSRLTDLGQKVFDLVATEEEKEDIAREKRYKAAHKLQQEQDRREHAWVDANRERLNANRDLSQKAYYAIEDIKKSLLEVAINIGHGANNVDDLLAENRRLVTELDAQEAIQSECKRQSEIFDKEKEEARKT